MRPTTWALVVVALSGCRPTMLPPNTLPDGGAVTPGECSPGATRGTGLRLLTRAEYNNTVRDLLGDATGPAKDFLREPLAGGLDNNAALLKVSSDGVSRYLEASEALSLDVVTNRRDRVVPCTTRDLVCANRFINEFGLRAYRRPLADDERSDLSALFTAAQTATDFDTAVSWTLQSMLQAPQFLYREEAPIAALPTVTVKLNGFELATRLSYFLWATTPDDELLVAAANGVLDTPEGLTAQAQRLLGDARALDGLMRFFSLWLYLDGVQTVEKNTLIYPQWSHELSVSWRRSLELYLLDVLQKDGTLTGLLTANVLFSNDQMSMYGAAAPNGDFVRTQLAGPQRKGLLVQPGFLAFKALPDSSSPVRRGVFVLDKLACQPPQPPPVGLAIVPPAPSTGATTRERFNAHSTDPSCHGCHQFIDPPGFTFEHYDGLGRWRDEENLHPIDATGGIVNAKEEALRTPVDGAEALQQVLAGSRQVHDCLAKQFFNFALGRDAIEADRCTLTQVGDRFMNSGGNFKELMLAIAQTDAFRLNTNPELTP